MLPLSVLDLFPVVNGVKPSQALRDSIELAKRVDELGYTRYWIAEHHNMPGIASAAPEVLIGHVAGVTKRIRVGSGGIMVPNHTPLRVIEIFRTLEALYPGRIDLGLGRAPGTDQLTSAALRRSGREVNAELAELLAFGNGQFPAGHPFEHILAMPSDVVTPPIWMLGSTQAGAAIAAQLGCGFAFAGHFSMSEARGALQRYREDFEPHGTLTKPHAILAVSVVCAETKARAEELALPLKVSASRLGKGKPAAFATIEEAKSYPFGPEDHAIIERFTMGSIVGDVDHVRREIPRMAETLGADEVMISSLIPDLAERIASYDRIARALLSA
ncbi:MAG: LLM class flavin-dependent oxidoreductase [Polyangia bacterium]